MPIYVYECQSCHQQWEYMQAVSDPPMTACETCEGKLEKIIAPTAFVLKGGGWYKDLYSSSKAPSSSSKPESTTKSESGTGSGTGSGSGSGTSGDKK